MKILHVFKTYFPDSYGGIEQVIRQICLGTSQQGFSNRVFTLSANPSPENLRLPEAEIIRSRLDIEIASTGFSFAALKNFKKQVIWADVIHYHFPWPFADILHCLYGHKKPSLATYHSDIVRQRFLMPLYRPLRDRFLSNLTAIVATSPNYVKTSPVLQKYLDKVHVIPIGVDKTSYPVPTAASLNFWQEKLGNNFFLFVGVLRYYKGLSILLEAIKNSSIQIVIVGAGPEEPALKIQAEQLKLTNLKFLGALPDEDKIALLTLCRGVVFPSHLRTEAYGVSLLEGAMYGKPLISCEIGTGSSYININNETGLVIPPNSPEALRNAMEFFQKHPQQGQIMGEAAYQRYLTALTAQRMTNAYVKLYQKLCGNLG